MYGFHAYVVLVFDKFLEELHMSDLLNRGCRQKSFLPPFECAETRSLAEALCRYYCIEIFLLHVI